MSLRSQIIRLAFDKPHLRSQLLPLVASAGDEKHKTMVALYPPPQWIEALREHADGSQADTLHMTLVYLGHLSLEEGRAIIPVVEGACRKHKPFEINLSGAGAFFNDQNVRVLLPNGVGLNEFRAQIAIDLLAHDMLGQQTHGFLPHMTLEYHEGPLPDGWASDLSDLVLPPWSCTEVVVVQDDVELASIPLGSIS